MQGTPTRAVKDNHPYQFRVNLLNFEKAEKGGGKGGLRLDIFGSACGVGELMEANGQG